MDVDDRSQPHHRINLAHLSVRDRDTPRRPIRTIPVRGARTTVDEDLATRRLSARAGIRHVFPVGVRNTDRQIEGAVGISAIDDIAPLGRLAVTFELLVPIGGKAKVDIIALQNFGSVQKIHLPGALVYNDPRDFWPVITGNLFAARRGEKKGKHSCDCDDDPHGAPVVLLGRSDLFAPETGHLLGMCGPAELIYDL